MSSEGFKDPQQEALEANHTQVEAIIEDFKKGSKNSREMTEDGREVIKTPEGETFFVKKLEDVNDPRVEKAHAFMLEEFGEDESETMEWFKHSIEDNINDYFILEDEGGKIVALTNTQL